MASSPVARRLRLLVPAGVLAVLLLAGLVESFSASAVPDLPALSAQQLIAKVQQTKVRQFSGTIELASSLGIPNLSSLQGNDTVAGFNPADLLSGAHRADVAVDGPDRQRLAMKGALSEIDVVHNGRDLWTWQSDGSLVSHRLLPAHADKPDADAADKQPAMPVPTPEALAKQFLDKITPSTAVSVDTPAQIAGHDAYELVLTPHAATSTIDHVAMAIDASNGFPLQVSAWAKGANKPAVRLGFVKLDYAKPSGSFTFSAPPGSKTTTQATAERRLRFRQRHHQGAANGRPPLTPQGTPSSGTSNPHGHNVVGQDWTQVVILDHFTLPRGQGYEIMHAATSVSGAFGSGRLLRSDLVNVLFLNDGRVAVGFVTPSALEAAVAHA
ncbi:MAG: hypothetical protein JO054_07695 [Actinobacteria bacterium]|nr:hypothetical protein [Actinomycetota bacterium]